jgi:hypothetical protein
MTQYSGTKATIIIVTTKIRWLHIIPHHYCTRGNACNDVALAIFLMPYQTQAFS